MNKYAPCPCHSGQSYQNCCRRFHQGEAPESAVALMRSRYCAFALSLADYIVKTTHPKNSDYSTDLEGWKQSIKNFSQGTQFRSLEILDSNEKEKSATVTFKAGLMQGLQDASFTERSQFEKIDNRWLYLSGEMVGTR